MKFKSLLLSALSIAAVSNAHALTYSESPSGQMMLQGGSQSTVSWSAPTPGTAEVYVAVPRDSTAKSATYRVYPKGTTDTTICSAIDTLSPCFEIVVNQRMKKGELVKLSRDKMTSWNFSSNGFVSVLASKSMPGELVGAEGARFNQVAQTLKYSKISNAGDKLPNSAVVGTADTDWGCTRDDNTGLVWELKTTDKGLRDKDNQYSWYDPNPETNGGNAGLQDGGKGLCNGGIMCDTNAYVQAVNAQGLCGAKDWRMPTFHELVSLVDPNIFPVTDATYFPGAVDDRIWSATTDPAYPSNAFYFYFGNGTASLDKASAPTMRIRLVRGGM